MMQGDNQFSPYGSLRRREPEKKTGKGMKFTRDRQFFIVAAVLVVFLFGVEVTMFHQLELTQRETSSRVAHSVATFQKSGASIVGSIRKVSEESGLDNELLPLPEHLKPAVPILPLFDSVENADDHISSLMEGRPSMAGLIAYLQKIISELHRKNRERLKNDEDGHKVLSNFYEVAENYIAPFDELYRGKSIFPLRSDDSIFISVAAFREHLLTQTLVSAFKHAKNPEKLYVGAVVQNCFGTILDDGTIDTNGNMCLTGPVKVGEKPNGKAITERLSKPPDANGIADFCALPLYEKYCRNGQVRVVYMHHTDSLGPSMARYFASKLWGGETFVMQIDSHLHFAQHWDAKYVEDIKLTRSYPKSVMSTYPPGFDQVKSITKKFIKANNVNVKKLDPDTVIETPGCRLCGCGIPKDGKDGIIHINQGGPYKGGEPRPTQTPFIGAGFVFFRGDFFEEVPFDPYLPWTFMGEEILLSMRAWTHGWNIFAPRKNLITHEYRPGITGIPRFVGAVNSEAKKGFNNGWMQSRTIRRIKNMCGYPLHTTEKIKGDNQTFVLVEKENYGLGTARSWDDFMEFAGLSVNGTTGALDCVKGGNEWCNKGELE